MGMLASDNLFDVMGVWSAPWLAAGAARGARRASIQRESCGTSDEAGRAADDAVGTWR